LEQVLHEFAENGLSGDSNREKEVIDLGLTKIPEIERDFTDRNRTSPFPFTDNRFEFRAVGASANCAAPLTVLNTIVADQLQNFATQVEELDSNGDDVQSNLIYVLQSYMRDVDRIVFNGDGYAKEWEIEAEKRGLSNNKTTPAALKAMLSERTTAVFERQHVLNADELQARYNVLIENYIHTIGIEADLFQEMSHNYVFPAAYQTMNRLAETYRNLQAMGLSEQTDFLIEQTSQLQELCGELNQSLKKLQDAVDSANDLGEQAAVAAAFAENVKPRFGQVRTTIDSLEALVDDKEWKLPKYRELLFIR
jgi:glutamine synthetase